MPCFPCHALVLPALALVLAGPIAAQTVLSTHFGTVGNGRLGTVLRAVGDQNGDGVADFVVSEPGQSSSVGGRVYLISGATRATLTTFQGQAGSPNIWGLGNTDVNPIGDANGDGRGDFAIGMNNGVLDVFSGLTGARLYRLGPAQDYHPYACSVGDFDGDGRSDFVAPINLGGNLQLWVIRGLTGTQLTTLAAQSSDGRLRNVGDQNGDGFAEIALITNATCDVYNLHPPGLLRRVDLANASAGGSHDLTDWNQDGRLDLVFQYQVSPSGGPALPFLFVYSLATGALLRSYQLPGDLANDISSVMSVLGDVDADGALDFAVQVNLDPILVGPYGHITVLSGRTGKRIGSWPGSAQFPIGVTLAGLGDVDADTFPDFVIGNAGINGHGGWQVISGRGLAAMLVKSSNCYSGPFPPEIGMTRPVLGGTTTIAGRDAPVGAPGMLVLSLMPTVATNLGVGGCDAWFDLGSGALLAPLSVAPVWQLGFALPNVRQLLGTEIALQAVYFGTNTPLGYDLTNGLWARLGY